MTGSLFRTEVINHQREKLWGEVTLTQPLSVRLLSGLVATTVVALIVFLTLGTYTRKETVHGYLVPSSGLVRVYAHQPGTVTELLVEPGDTVRQGEALMRISTDKALEDGFALNTLVLDLLDQQKSQLEQRIERHERRREARKAFLHSKIRGHEEQIDQFLRQRKLQSERKALAESRYASLSELHRDSLISDEDYEARYQALLDERQRYEQIGQSLISERARLEDARFELDSLDSDTQETLDQLESEISRISQQRLQHRGEHAFTIQAPTDGHVSGMQVTRGQTVDPQRPLLTLLPEGDELQVELFVPTQAIGFIKPGLPVKVRYDAFPYERFGVHESQVQSVARTILAPHEIDAPVAPEMPVYRVAATLGEQAMMAYGQSMPLQAGMTVEADILLDERPLYQWILRPLYSLRGTL